MAAAKRSQEEIKALVDQAFTKRRKSESKVDPEETKTEAPIEVKARRRDKTIGKTEGKNTGKMRKKTVAATLEQDMGLTNTKHCVTKEGYKIYTLEELGIKADSGGTPDCPFDCQCCV